MARQRKRPRQDALAFGADTYRAGAQQRLEDARVLKDSGRFALSFYSGGLAVEGMLRSLCCLKSREFDEKHDLRKFAVRVGELGLLQFGRDDDFVGSVEAVAKRWRNTLRFADDAHLERFLRATGAIRRRATVKRVCTQYFDDCSLVVKRCELLWRKSQEKRSRSS